MIITLFGDYVMPYGRMVRQVVFSPNVVKYFEDDMAVATKAKKAKKSAPPKPAARKDTPINAEYEDKAKALLKFAMSQRGVGIDQLAERLNKMGVEISAGGLANKISRGGFSSMFMLQCMDALEINVATLPR